MRAVAEAMRRWGPLGVSLFTLAALVLAALAYFVARPPVEDAIETTPYHDGPAEDLAMGDGLPDRGIGAAPNTAFPRFTSRTSEVIWKPVRCTDTVCQWSPRGNNNIEAIVVHVAGGRPDQCDGTANYLSNNALLVSAHFLVCDKKVYQQVEVGDAAHHAGRWGATVNPEHNPIVDSWWRNRINPNVRTVGIETMLTPGYHIDNYPRMRENLIELLVWLVQQTGLPPDRLHIIGHYETDYTDRKVDPVCCMDLNAITAEVAARVFSQAGDEFCCEQDYGGRFNITRDRWEWRPDPLFIWTMEDPTWRCFEGCP